MIKQCISTQTINNRGFTLIELIVVVSLSMLVMSMAIGSYITFDRKQKIVQSGEQLVTLMRMIQSKAASGDVPEGCTSLTSYTITGVEGNTDAQVTALCADPPGETVDISTYSTLASDIYVTDFTVTFPTLVSSTGMIQTISVTGDPGLFTQVATSPAYDITISNQGVISKTVNYQYMQ
jgi:prepilin-type N-terminal cleavage/methylation domain-containing protein